MTLIELFTRFRGRIGRKSWWIGSISLCIAGLAGNYLIDPETFQPDREASLQPHLGQVVWAAILLLPTIAIALKRLNDRDQPAWIGYLFAGLSPALLVAFALGDHGNPAHWDRFGQVAFAAVAMFGLWVFIDNGFLKGTSGPNRHGPDPLAPDGVPPAGSAVPSVRSWGANIRDGLVGLVALVVVGFLVAPSFGIAQPMHALLGALLSPKSFQVDIDRLDNKPALEALRAGGVAAKAGDHETAITHFTRSIALYGETQATAASAYEKRARSLRRLGRLQDALEDNDRAVALEPDRAFLHAARARTLRKLGRHEQALDAYETAARLAPDVPYHHIDSGRTLRDLGRHERSLKAFTAAIEAAAMSRARNAKRLETLDAGQADKKAMYQAWRDGARRTKARAHVNRGNAYRDLGQTQQALTDYEAALRANPKNVHAYRNRGWLHEKQGETELALADYERAAELGAPDDWLRRALDRVKARVR